MARTSHAVRDARKPGWFYIDGALLTHHGAVIGAYGIAVYAALAHKAAESGSSAAIIGYDKIAALIGVSKTKVISTLREMEKAGVITIEPQTDVDGTAIGANIYTLCALPSDQKAIAGEREVSPHDTPVSPHDTPHAPRGTGGYRSAVPGGITTRMRHDQYHIESDSPTPTPTARKRTKGDGGGDVFFRELRRRQVGQTKARQIADRYPHDADRILALIDHRPPSAREPTSPAFGRLLNDILDGVAGDYVAPRAVENPAPAPTKPNIPEVTVSPAEVLRQRARHDTS